MSPRGSLGSYGVRSFATSLVCRYRVSSGSMGSTQTHQHMIGGMRHSNLGYGFNSSMHQMLSISNGDLIKIPESKIKCREKEVKCDPDPPRGNIFSWLKWILGSILPLIFSFWKKKWDNLLKLEGKVEDVVKEAEEVAEVVENVASSTEKLSAEVAEKLDNGKMKEVAQLVEHVSHAIAKDARMTEDFIHKVGDLKKDWTDLEAMVEPVIDKIHNKK